MKKTKKALASLAIASMVMTTVPFNAFAADVVSTRLAGTTASQTAVAIADQTGWTGTVILASSESYGASDALTVGPLAKFLNAPILLQEHSEVLNSDTKAEIVKLHVRTVYVTSGTAVISQGVLDQLKDMGITVESLGGNDRFETSVNIAKKMISLGANVNKVALAYGWLNQDALSIASIASAQTEPILLTEKNSIPASVKAFMDANASIISTDVIGGTGVISDFVKDKFPSTHRYSGNTAYDTNVAVLKGFDSVLKYDHVFIANGETEVDALTGAPLAAIYNSGIVLTNGTKNEGTSYVSSKLTATSIVNVLGGTAVVPEIVSSDVVYVEPTTPIVPPVVDPVVPVTPISSGGGYSGGGGYVPPVVDPQIAIVKTATDAVGTYESAQITNLNEIAIAEEFLIPAENATNYVTNVETKDALTTRITAKTLAIATAKTVLNSETIVTTSEELTTAISIAKDGDIISVNGILGSATTEGYAIYNVTKSVTIKGFDGNKVYGTFNLKTDGATLDKLNVYNRGGGSDSLKNAVNVVSNSVNITDCVFEIPNPDIVASNGGVGNGIVVWPYGDATPNLNIKDNTFKGYGATVPDWSSTGMIVAEDIVMSRVDMPDKNSTKITIPDEQKLVTDNTFIECDSDYVHQNWSDTSNPQVLYSGVSNSEALLDAIDNSAENATILVADGIYLLTKELDIAKPLTIIGTGNVIVQVSTDLGKDNSTKHALGIYAKNVKIKGLTIDSDSKAYGVQAYGDADVNLEDVTIKSSKGAGLTVNGSKVTANNLNTSGNAWGAVNVDPGVSVTTPSIFTLNGGTLTETNQIWSDGANIIGDATVEVNADGYASYSIDGTTTNGKYWTNVAPLQTSIITPEINIPITQDLPATLEIPVVTPKLIESPVIDSVVEPELITPETVVTGEVIQDTPTPVIVDTSVVSDTEKADEVKEVENITVVQ